jgi:Domain of unknown function (DUF6438)
VKVRRKGALAQLGSWVMLLWASGACSRSAPIAEATAPDRPNDPAEARISLERTACLGDCPAYTVSVDGAGNVRFEGDRYVAQPGAHEWQVDRQVVEHLLKLFDRVRFLETEFECERVIYDAPTLVITLRVGMRERTIRTQWIGSAEFSVLRPGYALDRDLDAHAES